MWGAEWGLESDRLLCRGWFSFSWSFANLPLQSSCPVCLFQHQVNQYGFSSIETTAIIFCKFIEAHVVALVLICPYECVVLYSFVFTLSQAYLGYRKKLEKRIHKENTSIFANRSSRGSATFPLSSMRCEPTGTNSSCCFCPSVTTSPLRVATFGICIQLACQTSSRMRSLSHTYVARSPTRRMQLANPRLATRWSWRASPWRVSPWSTRSEESWGTICRSNLMGQVL